VLDGPTHKGIFPYVRPLIATPNFYIMIYPAQIVWPLQSVSYSLPRPFTRVRFEEGTYAPQLSTRRQIFPVRTVRMICKFGCFLCTLSIALICPSLYGSQHAAPYSRIGRTRECRLNFLYYHFPFWVFTL
jgi:hypothetical protein